MPKYQFQEKLLFGLILSLLYQFFMKLHRIRSPLAPLNKGGTGKTSIKVPLIKGDLGGSRYVQLHIKLVLGLTQVSQKIKAFRL
jgi:hypothetical protein